MKNKTIYKVITSTLLCGVICVAVIYNFVCYFEYDYIHHSSLTSMALKETVISDIVTLAAVQSVTDNPNEKAIYITENLVIEEEPSNNAFAMDLSRSPAVGEILLTNETAYKPDLISLLKAPYPITRNKPVFVKLGASKKDEPLVLILHTHGTEAYYPLIRSSEITENIVSIGAVMSDILNNRGVLTLHCDIMHDAESYLNSYNRSKETILKYLEEYPSILYVFDVHRDAVIGNNGETIKTVTDIDGMNTAQVMSVVGSDYKSGYHPNWLDNLNIAVKLQNLLNSEYPNIARPINIRSATFNAQYAPASLLLEIGSSGNTLPEAKRAAIITANKLADLILGSE
jgi:stage II sporulation protein P